MNAGIRKSIALYGKTLAAPPPGEFIHGGITYEEVYLLAEDIFREMTSADAGERYCIGTDDKSIILAALIAAYFSGSSVVLPYAFSPQVLAEARDAAGFSRIITGRDGAFMEGVEPIVPRPLKRSSMALRQGDPDRTFLYLFTGGTTGTPRIWAKTPRNLLSEAFYQTGLSGFVKSDVIMATVPPYHIYGLLFSVIIPLVAGASVLNEVRTFPQEIWATLRSGVPTVFVSVPMHYRVLGGNDAAGHRLRLSFSSAGMLDPRDGENFYRLTGVGVREVYGSTETGGIAWRCRPEGGEYLRPLEPVACKITGERLAVKSDFISPDIPRDQEGYFLTGDRAAAAEGGLFQLLGRSDGVVKVGGKRVDLADVQDKISHIPGVDDAYLLSLKGRAGRENEIAALVQGAIDEGDVRREAALMLEPYAVPRRIKIVERIPVLSTGKYDRKAIEEIFINGKK